jgi:hypothetical protein
MEKQQKEQLKLPFSKDVKMRCLWQRAISTTIMIPTEGKEAVLNAQRKY